MIFNKASSTANTAFICNRCGKGYSITSLGDISMDGSHKTRVIQEFSCTSCGKRSILDISLSARVSMQDVGDSMGYGGSVEYPEEEGGRNKSYENLF